MYNGSVSLKIEKQQVTEKGLKKMNRLARRALHTSQIPEDLETVTFRDTAGENPAAAGVSQETVDALWRSVQSLYRTGVHPGFRSPFVTGANMSCTGPSAMPVVTALMIREMRLKSR